MSLPVPPFRVAVDGCDYPGVAKCEALAAAVSIADALSCHSLNTIGIPSFDTLIKSSHQHGNAFDLCSNTNLSRCMRLNTPL